MPQYPSSELPAAVAHAPSPSPSCRELQAIRVVKNKIKKGASPRSPMFADTCISWHHHLRHRHHTWFGRRACAGWAKHVVDLDVAVARAGPHEVGAGRTAKPPGGPQVGEHAPEEIATKYSSCDERCGSIR